MAGVSSRDSCKQCSSTSCTCGDKGTWSEPSLLSQRLSEDSSRQRLLQKWTSMYNSLSGEASVAYSVRTQRKEAAEPAEEEDWPLVFLCSGCRRPLGDSLSWVTSQEDTNCILLRYEDFSLNQLLMKFKEQLGYVQFIATRCARFGIKVYKLYESSAGYCTRKGVSYNVSVNKEQILSKRENENGCILETLYCTGCSLNLGHIYRCTPNNLDYKRDLFCLSVEAIESYALGSAEKQIVSEDTEVFNLESRIQIENSVKQIEDVLQALQTKLWEVESKLSFASSKS